MNNTLYVGLSRQMTLQREMDVIANNLSNTDTAGFKVESMMLSEDVQSPVGHKLTSTGTPVDPIAFVNDVGLARDFAQGSLKQTGATFDLGLQGDGFFQVQTPTGPRFTRDGRFSLNATGQLTDVSGAPVMGTSGSPIVVDPQKSPPTIAHDGTVSQEGQQIGKIGVFRFADRSALNKSGSSQYDANGQAPLAATDTKVVQGMTENSNVDPITMMTRMIAVSRAYEQVANMMDQTGSTSDQSIQRLGRVN